MVGINGETIDDGSSFSLDRYRESIAPPMTPNSRQRSVSRWVMEWRTNNYLVKERDHVKERKMRLVTIQASAFKSTFETLKDILNDVNIFFRRMACPCTLDVARTSLVDLFLAKENFEEYECDEEEIICGVNIANTFKLFKTITNTDVLTLSIPPGGKEYLHIEISSEAKKQSSSSISSFSTSTNHGSRSQRFPTTRSCPRRSRRQTSRGYAGTSNIGSEIAIALKENVLKLQCRAISRIKRRA